MALRYADTLSTGAAVVSPHIIADWGSAVADAVGTYSEFTSGGRSGQGTISLARFIPHGERLFGELAGFAGGSAHSDGSRTGEFVGNARAHFTRADGEVFLGAGAGRTWDGATWRNFVQAEAGTSVGSGPLIAMLSITPTMVDDSTKYADAQGSLGWKRERFELDAQAGLRVGHPLTTLGSDQKAWASASAAMYFMERVALVAAGGTYPVNPTEGFPGGRFISLSLRLRRSPTRAVVPVTPETPAAQSASEPASIVVSSLAITRATSDNIAFTATAVGARTVEIAGDFTNWAPVSLTATGDGHWAAMLPLKPGKYEMNIRVDGGQWIVPPGLLSMADEFGGTVGLLVIE